jgi:hypothetical protein
MAEVAHRLHGLALGSLGRPDEAGPSGSGVELVRALKERLVARDAAVRPLVVAVPVGTGEGALGALAAGDLVLFGGQLLAPLGVGFSIFL